MIRHQQDQIAEMKKQNLNEHRFFKPSANEITRLFIFIFLVVLVGGVWAATKIFQSPYITRQNIVQQQPIPFSHKHHVGARIARL